MRTPADIYAEYKIMPSLQLHQLRVAAVAKLICDNLDKPIDERNVVLACLFHDMGNIIKSDLTKFPDFRADKGLEYWEGVKASFIKKYGKNTHEANVAIAKEIGLPAATISYIDSVSFSNLDTIVASASYEQKICEYADTRVGPYGILPLRERLEEARSRYVASGKNYYTEEGYARLSKAAEELEEQIFAEVSITPQHINDAAITPVIEELRTYAVA